ncbi:flagellar filament capping protein FliD [bacterium]|nr:flagellar filament capping protein FliD [bacterium]
MTQITGLASGMDIQGLITDLMKIEKQSVSRLEDKTKLVSLKKDVYKSVSSQMESFQKTLLKLKLESTFQTKKTTSSNSSVLTGSAGVNASSKTYSMRVSQLAESAWGKNSISKMKFITETNTSGASSVYGNSRYNIEGKYKIDLEDKSSYVEATSTLTLDKKGIIQKTSGTSLEGTTEQTIGTNINRSNNRLNISYGDYTFDIELGFYQANSSKISSVTDEIQQKINSELNSHFGTENKTYVMLESSNPDGSNNASLSFYNVAEDSNSYVKINNDGGGDLANSALGLTNTTSQTVNSIQKKITALDFDSLRTTMNNNSFLNGYSIRTLSSLKQGSFETVISSTLNPTPITKSKIQGGSDVATGTINLFTTGLNNSGIKAPITGVVGADGKKSATFTINNVAITLNDIDNITMNDALAMINGSKAGVTATYDSINDRFMLTSNTTNSAISLGANSDNSNFLTSTKLSLSSGGTAYNSSSTSSIDTNKALYLANLGATVSNGTFSINGVSIYVNQNDSLNGVIEKINNSSAGVIASYDTSTDQFLLYSKMGDVDTNQKRVTIGSSYDTSNFLEVMNISSKKSTLDGDFSSISGNFAGSTINFGASGVNTDITLSATNGTGAYTELLDLDFTTGITSGTSFIIMAGTDGSTGYRWTNNSGKTIYSKDDLIREWNNTANWTTLGGSSTNVQVKMLGGEGESVRLFNSSGGAAASFTIFNDTGSDISQIGLGSGVTQSDNTSDTASAIYNSLSIAYDISWKFDFGGSGLSVQADGLGGIKFESETAGIAGKFQITDVSGTVASSAFAEYGVSSLYEEIGVAGKDANFMVDGVSYVRSTNDIDDVIKDVSFQLNGVSETNVTLDIQVDTDKVLEEIADFVVGYNDLMTRLNPDKLSSEQKKYLNPLSSDDMNNMTYTEIEDYNTYFKMYNEYNIIFKEKTFQDFGSYMRQAVTSIRGGMPDEFSSLDVIGLKVASTGSNDDAKAGYLLFGKDDGVDSDEYRESILKTLKENNTLLTNLKENSYEVYRLFANNSETNPQYDSGIARVIDNKINDYVKRGGILKEATVVNGTIDKELVSLYEQIEYYQTRNEQKEAALYNQFATMEAQLSKIQSDSTNFLAQMGLS